MGILKIQKQPYRYDPLKDGVTQGALMTFLTCRKLADFTLFKGLRQKRESVPLTWGTLMHAVLERWYHDGTVDVEAYLENYAKENAIGKWSPDEEQEFETTAGQIMAVFKGYQDYWKKNDKAMDWVAQEQKFSLPLNVGVFNHATDSTDTFQVQVRGMIDGVFRTGLAKAKTGKKPLWITDHKTKGQIDEDMIMDTLERDFQIHLYAWACLQLYGEVPTGVLYNVVRRPQLRLKQKEKLKDFQKRVEADVKERPEHYFKRFEYTLDSRAIGTFETELKQIVGEFLSWNRDGRPSRMFGNPCQGKYGSCALLPYCYFNRTNLYKQKDAPFPELANGKA